MLIVVAILGISAGLGAGPFQQGLGRARLQGAARVTAQRMMAARWRAVSEGRSVGLRFRQVAGTWEVRTFLDGDGDGLRSGDIATGTDVEDGIVFRPGEHHRGVRLGIPPGRYPRVPPSRGFIQGGEDPVRLGRSDLASFSPLGNATSGTVYFTDGSDRLAAVVLFGPTARIRVLRFEAGAWR
jgi:hypothetical protein